ncbi:MAG: aspartate aminotransferase [Dehalococcoidia bacterium]|nr:aspartate aminotransferase [Dehalococcoidia bacterium]
MVTATAVRFATRMADLGTESAFEVLARARQLERQGQHIIHMEIGEPDFPTPQHIKDAANDALGANETKYGPSAGVMPCREAVAAYVSETRGVPVRPEQVVITPGAKPPIFYAALALVDEGDEVLLPDPGFPIYESVVAFVGGRPISVPLSEANEFRFDVEELGQRITSRTKMIILNSPQNPTGSVLTAEDVAGIAGLARDHDLWVISDEIYSRLLFEGDAPSVLSEPGMAERTVLVDGFSKAYSMTGWRLGYGVMPEELAEGMAQLQNNCSSCTTTFIQYAGIAALQGPQESVDEMVAAFQSRRDLVVGRLNEITGVHCLSPHGAFYVFPRVEIPGLTSKEIADYLLERSGVAILAGTAFGNAGEGYLRLSIATATEQLEAGLDRMVQGLDELRAGQRL